MIEKKINASDCAYHRKINLITYVKKMLRLIGKRLEKKAK